MDFKQLRHFCKIAECGSLSIASGVLHVAQPALSKQMQALERELNCRLFHRTGRGVSLTAAGQTLFEEASKLLGDADQIRHRLRTFEDELVGEATIGLSPTIGRLLTLPLAQRVRDHHPRLTLRIAEAFSGTLFEWLQAGRIDAAILYHVPPVSSIRSEIIAEEPLSVIGSPIAPIFPLGFPVPISALEGQPLVLSTPSHGLRRMVEAHASAAGAKLKMLFEFDSLDATIALVKQGMALTILPESAVQPELASGALVAWRIGEPEAVRPLVIATAAQRPEAIGGRDLANLLREVILSASSAFGWRAARHREPTMDVV